MYRALDFNSQGSRNEFSLPIDESQPSGFSRNVIVKEARFAGEMSREGFSATDRLRWQAHILEKFADMKNFPKVIDLFEFQKNLYLALENIPGLTIHQLLSSGIEPSFEKSLRIALHLGRVLESMHDRGVICGDISPSNVIVDDDDSIFLFDLEHAFFAGRPWASQGGTPGFYSSHEAPTPSPNRDVFALGAVLRSLLVPRWYLDVQRQLKEGIEDNPDWEIPDLPESIPSPIRDLAIRAYRVYEEECPINLKFFVQCLSIWCSSETTTNLSGSPQ